MAVLPHRSVEVFRVHPATLWVTVLAALLLQALLPLKLPTTRVIDFPLLVTIYFALLRRSKPFGTGLGAVVGLLQDALSHGYIGMFGMAKTLVGYLAAWASVQFEVESLLARAFMTGIFVFVHNLFLAGLRYELLHYPTPLQPLAMASGVLLNVALGLILFTILDRFRQPA
jgi:rod shape-determining protein MreD